MQPDQRTSRPLFQRAAEIARLQSYLERDGYPRLQMMVIVALTGGSGFLASYAMLHAGLNEMWLRYLCAFGIAYVVFLLLLWIWMRTRASDYVDNGDVANLVHLPSTDSPVQCGGSQLPVTGNGGASTHVELTGDETPLTSSADSTPSAGDVLSTAADADELALPLMVLIMIGALLLSSFWIVYSAPLLFSELMLEGLLAAGLYRRLRKVESEHWIVTAIKRTFWPFLLTALLFATTGWLMQKTIPEARSVGEFIHLHAQVR